MDMKDVKKIVVPNPDKIILPSGYTQKTYISKIGDIISSGYIDLGITPTANTNIECTFEYTATTVAASVYHRAIFGAFRGESLASSTNGFFLSIYKSWNSTDAKSLALGYGDKKRYAYDQFTSDTIYTFRNDGGNVYINDVLNADLSTNDSLFNGTMGKLMIGACGGRNDYGTAITTMGSASFKLYRFKVWENGVLIKDLVPAVQESTSYISLYDLVNNEFITPTINFDNYGNNVEATKEVKKIEDANGNVLWVEPAVARNLAINFARSWCNPGKTNGTVDCFTLTNMSGITAGSAGAGAADLYMSCKLDGGSSQGVWNGSAAAWKTSYTIGPASVFQIAIIIPGGAIGSASSSSTSQDATVTLPSSSTAGYTLISNTQLARAGGSSTKHGRCRRVVFQYSGSGNINITTSSTHPSYYTSRYTISIS